LERFSGKWSSGRGQASRRVMVGTGCASLDDTVTLTAHSVATGFPHVLMLPPYYYKAPSDEGLFKYYSEVITRVLAKGHKELAVYLYHIPQFSGAPISLQLIQRLRAAFPANVVGIKDSTGDWNSTRAIAEANPGWGVFCGTEQVTHYLSYY
jgi:4-hydroxy-tetrahydrodipicolinate synthase